MIRKLFIFALLLCFGTLAQATSLKTFSGNPTPPPLMLKDLQGKTQSLDAYKGKVVLVQFWATYCGPCRKEMPTMNQTIKTLAKDGVPFKILAIDMGESETEVREFVDQVKPEFTILLDESGKSIQDWKVFAVRKRIDSGLDNDGNGSLDASEIASTDYICDGVPGVNGTNGSDGIDGLNALIDMNPEPVGVNCPNGGLRIDVGIDTNDNSSLDPAEITQTGFVCSGTDGSLGWQVATLIETDNDGTAIAPQVSVDASGNAVAVWQQFDGTRYNIWSNRYVVGTGWGAAQLVETDNTGSANSSQVSVGASGNAVAVWYQSDGTRNNIWSNRWVAP